MVSTYAFSDQAIRLARERRIQLRLLLPESQENTRQWYRRDYLGITSPIVEIDKCSLLVVKSGKIHELRVDQIQCSEKNILVGRDVEEHYAPISLRRVFHVDVMSRPDREQEFIGRLPKDAAFHNATICVKYQQPSLHVRFDGLLADGTQCRNEILPIEGIVFFARVNRQFKRFPIGRRLRYVDADSNDILAQAILSEITIGEEQFYFCLVRYSTADSRYEVGGGFFK
jgi:hypothetical protein